MTGCQRPHLRHCPSCWQFVNPRRSALLRVECAVRPEQTGQKSGFRVITCPLFSLGAFTSVISHPRLRHAMTAFFQLRFMLTNVSSHKVIPSVCTELVFQLQSQARLQLSFLSLVSQCSQFPLSFQFIFLTL